MKVGFIGFGRLGQLIAQFLGQDFEIIAFDKLDKKNEMLELGVKSGTLEDVCQQSVVIPFVPISEFEGLIKQIAPMVNPSALILDVCSVKAHPVQAMKAYLPESVSIIGTHPMFGPDSAKDSLFGKKIVLCPVRVEKELFDKIKKYLAGHAMNVIEATPEEHDEQIAHSLLLAHYVGRALMEMDAQPLKIDTLGYRRLINILKTVRNDSWQLFEDMNRYNQFAPGVRHEFERALKSVKDKIEK